MGIPGLALDMLLECSSARINTYARPIRTTTTTTSSALIRCRQLLHRLALIGPFTRRLILTGPYLQLGRKTRLGRITQNCYCRRKETGSALTLGYILIGASPGPLTDDDRRFRLLSHHGWCNGRDADNDHHQRSNRMEIRPPRMTNGKESWSNTLYVVARCNDVLLHHPVCPSAFRFALLARIP